MYAPPRIRPRRPLSNAMRNPCGGAMPNPISNPDGDCHWEGHWLCCKYGCDASGACYEHCLPFKMPDNSPISSPAALSMAVRRAIARFGNGSLKSPAAIAAIVADLRLDPQRSMMLANALRQGRTTTARVNAVVSRGSASACPASAPYVCTGFPGQCSAYPPDHPLHGIDCKSYTTPPSGSGGIGTLRNPIVAGAGTTQTQPQYQTATAQTQQIDAVAANALYGNVGDAWLPATTGPQPPGAAVWVVWNGGGSGTRHYAGSAMTQAVQVLQHMAGGPTGVMVLVRPALGLVANPDRNPADCSDATTPADQCKWLCYPMPTPNDPHDMHCVRVPIEAQLGGAYFTSTPPRIPPRGGIFQRIARRVMGR